MKLWTKIRFAFDMILEEKKHFLLSVVLAGVGFFLTGLTALIYLAGNYATISAERVLSQGIDHTAVVNFKTVQGYRWGEEIELYLQKSAEFQKAAFDSELIRGIGSFSHGGIPAHLIPELYERQQGHVIEDANEGNLVMLYVDLEAFPIGNLTYAEGVAPDKLDYSKPDVSYLYLGHAYRDIPVGTRYIVDDQGTERTYEVAGIMQKDTAFLSTSLQGADVDALTNELNMNYEIVCVNAGGGLSWPWFVAFDKNEPVEAGLGELEQLATEYGIELELFTMKEAFEERDAQSAAMQEALLEALLLLLIVIVVVVTTLQIIQIYQRMRQYGIYYAVGFGTSDILWIMMIRNLIYLICSVGIGTVLMLTEQRHFVTNYQTKALFYKLVLGQVLPIASVMMIFIFVIISVVPCLLFHRMEPVELMQGD